MSDELKPLKVRRIPTEVAIAEYLPTLLVDSREQTPLTFLNLPSRKLRGDEDDVGLTTGDYSIEGFREEFIVERKSLADLLGCVMSERFEREMHRAQAYAFAAVVVTAPLSAVEGPYQRSKLSPRAVLAKLASLQARFRVPFHFFDDEAQAARQIERWAYYFVKGKLHSNDAIVTALAPKAGAAA